MSKLEQLPLSLNSRDNLLEIIQISDPHLFGESDGCLLGVNTRDSFVATLEYIAQQHSSPDLMVVTGDISQDLSAASYCFFAKAMSQFNCPVLCLAGNHDELGALESHAVNDQISTQKHIQIKGWQLLLAHSQVKGKVYGNIEPAEMDWIESQLANEQKTLIFTHHHPVFSDADWIDVFGIKNCKEFTHMLNQYENVKACGFGHIHQDLSIKQAHIQYYSAPSTCIQFKPHSKDFAVSDELPGYRVYHCKEDGSLETQVFRIQDFELTLDKTATGY